MTPQLDPAERDAALAALPLWRYDETRKALHRQLRFADFGQAVATVVRIALASEKADHHPE